MRGHQLELGEVPAAAAAGTDTILARFAAFHAEHPEVYAALVRLARIARARGARRVGMRLLWERLRWEIVVEGLGVGGDGFKLNNNFVPHYARLIATNEPELAELFELRRLRAV